MTFALVLARLWNSSSGIFSRKYRIARKFAEELNLAVWQTAWVTAKLKSTEITYSRIYIWRFYTKQPNLNLEISASMFGMAIWDPTAKFNSCQYFWLYGSTLMLAVCKVYLYLSIRQRVNQFYLSVYSTAVKDRIVAFLLFLGKVAITCAMGEQACCRNVLLFCHITIMYMHMHIYRCSGLSWFWWLPWTWWDSLEPTTQLLPHSGHRKSAYC